MSSSLVGTTRTRMAESAAEISRTSSLRTAFLASSILTPIHPSLAQMRARASSEFSPMPAEKAMVSKPSMASAISRPSWAER